MLNFNLKRRLPPSTSILPNPTMHTDDYAIPAAIVPTAQSFGRDFNIIRAVEEYGPQRVAAIKQEIAQMTSRQSELTNELRTLERLISATKSGHDTQPDAATSSGLASQDIAWATLEGYSAHLGSGFDMD